MIKFLFVIELREITKKFGDFKAVDNLSISIERGEFFGFLGPNGAGKTTTIKMMTGLFTPTSGTIRLNGYNISTESVEAKRSFGYIPDQPFLYDKLTGREFLYFIGGLYSLASPLLRKKIERLIEQFEMSDWMDQRAEEYSQGMRQRISIAASLIHEPPIIILDEPMIGLDPLSAKNVKNTLKEMSLKGTTVFMSTHSLHIVEELCSRIGIIKNGQLIYTGAIDRLEKFRQQSDGKFESIFIELTK